MGRKSGIDQCFGETTDDRAVSRCPETSDSGQLISSDAGSWIQRLTAPAPEEVFGHIP
jgi:hypothetical protein